MCIFECGEGGCRNREACARDLRLQTRMEAHLQQQPKKEPLNVPPGETFDVEDDYPVIMFGSGCKEH